MNKISETVLAGEIEILLDRFGRQNMLDVTLDRYAQYIEAHLTEDEFLLACRVIFENDTYWPSPVRFVEAARGNPKELADSEWNQLMVALKENPAELPVTERGRAALKAIGGYRALMEATDYSLESLRKRFMGAYADAGREKATTPVLPEAAALVQQ